MAAKPRSRIGARTAHQVRPCLTQAWPRNWVFFDCEAKITRLGRNVKEHRLRLGWACCRTDRVIGESGPETWFEFRKPMDFWRQALEHVEPDRRVIFVGYNVAYDMRIAAGFDCLIELGYEPQKIYTKGRVCVLKFGDRQPNVWIIDACNFFDGSLSDWGRALGLPKGKEGWRSKSDAVCSRYCRRDVEILEKLWDRWIEFCRVNECGTFGITRASQAFNCFRHRFMGEKIMVHNSPVAMRLENQSYFGGRVECFRIGRQKDGPWVQLDVNSLYPFVMLHTPVPTKLLTVLQSTSRWGLAKLMQRYAVVSRVQLSTDTPCYPKLIGNKLCFPIGRFWTTLSTPELAHAVDNKHVIAVEKTAVYEQAMIFSNYVKHFYKLRRQYKDSGQEVFAELVKYFLNVLYGKWGQRSERWDGPFAANGLPDGTYQVWGEGDHHPIRYSSICDRLFLIYPKQTGYNALVAIASHITSAARLYLHTLISKVGYDKVYYVDTDSILVHSDLVKRHFGVLVGPGLGELKIEHMAKRLIIYGPKDYVFGSKTRRKGVSKNATQEAADVYWNEQWDGLLGGIAHQRLDRVHVTRRKKSLRREYNKGNVHSDGSVSPFVLDES